MFQRRLIELLQALVLLLALLLVLENLGLVSCDRGKNLTLSLQELLLFIIELLSLGDDILFLLGETLVDLTLFPFLLEQAHSLQGTLALDNERPHPCQILISDLGLGILAQVLVDAIEQLVNLALLVDVHLFCFAVK